MLSVQTPDKHSQTSCSNDIGQVNIILKHFREGFVTIILKAQTLVRVPVRQI